MENVIIEITPYDDLAINTIKSRISALKLLRDSAWGHRKRKNTSEYLEFNKK